MVPSVRGAGSLRMAATLSLSNKASKAVKRHVGFSRAYTESKRRRARNTLPRKGFSTQFEMSVGRARVPRFGHNRFAMALGTFARNPQALSQVCT